MLRSVNMHAAKPHVGGELLLHSMPGRFEDWMDFLIAAEQAEVRLVVCLASDEEIQRKAPEYAQAMKNPELLLFERWRFPMPDYGVPVQGTDVVTLASGVAAVLRQGRSVVIHCAAGVGRTGTVACLVLMALGVPLVEALVAVNEAGSGPESKVQKRLLEDIAHLSVRSAPTATELACAGISRTPRLATRAQNINPKEPA